MMGLRFFLGLATVFAIVFGFSQSHQPFGQCQPQAISIVWSGYRRLSARWDVSRP
jgi:hypothetical protein